MAVETSQTAGSVTLRPEADQPLWGTARLPQPWRTTDDGVLVSTAGTNLVLSWLLVGLPSLTVGLVVVRRDRRHGQPIVTPRAVGGYFSVTMVAIGVTCLVIALVALTVALIGLIAG